MKHGDTLISPKDNQPEQVVLMGDGNLYGNRTNFNYGTMVEENKEENKQETAEETTPEETTPEETSDDEETD